LACCIFTAASPKSASFRQATCDDASVRDGAGAVKFAEQAVGKKERKNPAILDTLAAAYAEAGEFEKAVSVQKEAIALLPSGEETKDFLARLKLYESGSAYHEQ
jgi:Flp pilus assembly protein TadD